MVKSRITSFGEGLQIEGRVDARKSSYCSHVPAGEKRKSPCFLDTQRGDGQIITQCWRVRFMMSPYILMAIPFIFGLKMQLKMVKPVWGSEWRGTTQ